MMQLSLDKFQVFRDDKTVTKNYSQFEISGLSHGFGTTIGNSLRRVLLSSIPGSSVFAVRINSVTHEFQAVDGVYEDVSRIILNIKRLVFKIDFSKFLIAEYKDSGIETWPTLKVQKNKKGIVLGRDVVCPPGVDVVNKEMRICELTDDVQLDIEIYVTTGTGYKTFSENRENLDTLKIISIDSNFSPILGVKWSVVEEVAKYKVTDKLLISVATNGAVTPSDAISCASKILADHFLSLVDVESEIVASNIFKEEALNAPSKSLSSRIEELELNSRSFNCLKSNGINTIPELVSLTKKEIDEIRSLGKKSIKEIEEKLAERGLSFRAFNAA